MKEIIDKYFEGRASATEQMHLLKWLRVKENRKVFNSSRLVWNKSQENKSLPEGSEQSWLNIQDQMLQKSFKRWQYSDKVNLFIRVAAIFFFVLSLGGGAYIFSTNNQKETWYSEIEAENGQVSKVKLPDGSMVWLNSGSKIAYNNRFAEGNRDVKLEGEAYFEVQKNEDLSFVVNSGEIQVKVHGTKFNVAAYPESENIDVVLESGKVQLLSPEVPSFQYFLSPGERASFVKSNSQLNISEVNTMRYTSWKDGILNIYNQPLAEVVKRLEKRYNQEFEYAEELKDFHFTFSIKNEPLDEIISIMEKIAPIKTKQENNVIVFKLDQEKVRELSR
ncbi:FecR domain-containing protein [Draconibacterium sp. IB214405]|uniref:FecR family protein n=1 Tax=Draconibacterium sp. IB214405 TaxID=3097352 RepID=UPI002A0BEFD0|nr:FecR domain-containing protein [Draconibacterium sp. IB214405]MDX8339221.1 FecR domain-containing protein [Draconibacterium sp. IB214405]